MIYILCVKIVVTESLPVRGAWIEIIIFAQGESGVSSLPVRGAWIEMQRLSKKSLRMWSLPVRGAWIEM